MNKYGSSFDINLNLVHNIITDTFKVSGNCKDPKEIVSEFLRTQIGAGYDRSKPNQKDEYTIRINLDLSDDTFYIEHNCGNKSLRDGILLRFLNCKEK